MTISYRESLQTPLRTPAAIEERVADLVGVACVRQLWLFLLDEQGYQLPLLLPITVAAGQQPRDDALVPLLTALAGGVDGVHDVSGVDGLHGVDGVHGVIGVWERPGRAELSAADRAWVRSLHRAVLSASLESSGLLLSHSHGVRWLSPDDWI